MLLWSIGIKRVNALSRASLISTTLEICKERNRMKCVNALSRASLISTKWLATPVTWGGLCVNALSRASLISTGTATKGGTSEKKKCQCP